MTYEDKASYDSTPTCNEIVSFLCWNTHSRQPIQRTKLLVSFAEYCLFCRALLQKRPIILSILRTEATPYSRQPIQRNKLWRSLRNKM